MISWRTGGAALFLVSGILLLSMGGAIIAAPVTIPLMFVAVRRHPTRSFRIVGTMIAGMTVAEFVWALAYVIAGEAKPWIWLIPCVAATAAFIAFNRGVAPSAIRRRPRRCVVMAAAENVEDSVGCEFSGVGVPGVDQTEALGRHRAIAAEWRARGVDMPLSRGCVIAIAETYVQNLLVDEREMDALLNDDVVRWTEQNKADPPRDTSAQSIQESTRAGAERSVADIINRRWMVEGNQALMIADIVVPSLAKPVILYERFLVRWGQLAEIEAISLLPRP